MVPVKSSLGRAFLSFDFEKPSKNDLIGAATDVVLIEDFIITSLELYFF